MYMVSSRVMSGQSEETSHVVRALSNISVHLIIICTWYNTVQVIVLRMYYVVIIYKVLGGGGGVT